MIDDKVKNIVLPKSTDDYKSYDFKYLDKKPDNFGIMSYSVQQPTAHNENEFFSTYRIGDVYFLIGGSVLLLLNETSKYSLRYTFGNDFSTQEFICTCGIFNEKYHCKQYIIEKSYEDLRLYIEKSLLTGKRFYEKKIRFELRSLLYAIPSEILKLEDIIIKNERFLNHLCDESLPKINVNGYHFYYFPKSRSIKLKPQERIHEIERKILEIIYHFREFKIGKFEDEKLAFFSEELPTEISELENRIMKNEPILNEIYSLYLDKYIDNLENKKIYNR